MKVFKTRVSFSVFIVTPLMLRLKSGAGSPEVKHWTVKLPPADTVLTSLLTLVSGRAFDCDLLRQPHLDKCRPT